MQELDCHGDWLIDYADGVLPYEQRAAAEQHLAQCAACRREAAALQTSAARLNGYFEALRRTQQCSVLPVRSRWSVVAQRAAAAAACLALIVLGYWLNRQANRPLEPLHVAQLDAREGATTNNELPQTEHDDIAAEIARETQIARLKAAIAILKDEPGMSERSDSLQRYLSETYEVDYELPSM